MKVVDITSKVQKIEPEPVSETVEPKPTDVIEFGPCSGCKKSCRLTDHACDACRTQFGQKCGLLFQKFRESPKLSRRFYQVLTPGKQRTFIRLFGLPERVRALSRRPITEKDK